MRILACLSVLFLSLLLFAGCAEENGAELSDVQTFIVEKGNLKITLTESGTLQARNKVDIRSKVKAQVLSLVEEGSLVKAGDVLAELDKESVLEDIERLEDKFIQLEAELKNARTDLEIQEATNASDIEGATLKLRFAGLGLERYVEGDHKLQLRELELRLDEARDNHEKMPRLLKEGFVTQVDADRKKLAFESAQLELENYNKYTHPMTLEQKQSDVTEADRELKRVKARAEARVESKTAVLRQKDRQYETAKEKLEEERERLKNLTIIAPQAGIVIYGGRRDHRGNVEDEIKVGSTAYPGRTLIELPDLSLMDVKLQVHQADVRKLRKGLPVLITFPDKSAGKQKGTVTEIGSVAQSTSWRDPVKRFDVTVQLDDRVTGFRAGVTVEVEIDLGDLEDILYVPLQAVASAGSGFSVFVSADGEVRRQRVSLGRSNEQYVQVLKGLKPGEQVLLTNPELVTEDEGGEEAAPGKKGGGRPQSGRPTGGSGKKGGKSGNGGKSGKGRPGGK
jgi:HlyD family secretion protein